MVITSLIFLLLSNSIPLRRDKSILYSRATITILLISAFIAYDNLLFSFILSLIIGTVVGLTQSRIKRLFAFSTISHVGVILLGLRIALFIFISEELLSLANILALILFKIEITTTTFFIILISILSLTLAITLFYPIKLGYREYGSADRLLFTTLQSGTNTFALKIGSVCLITLYGDIYDYDSIVSFYHSITDAFSYLTNFNFGSRRIHPLIRNTYDLYIAMQDTTLKIKDIVRVNNFSVDYARLIGFPHMSHLLQFHSDLAVTHSIQRFVGFLLGSLVLLLGVNIHSIVELFVTVVNTFNNFINWLIKRCAGYYDPVKDSLNRSEQVSQAESLVSQSINTINSNKATSGGNGQGSGDGNGDGRRNNYKKPIDKVNYDIRVIILIQILVTLSYICERILVLRQGDNYSVDQENLYGSSTYRGEPNQVITLHQIIRYAVLNPNERVPGWDIPLTSIFSSYAQEYLNSRSSRRTILYRDFAGANFKHILVYSEYFWNIIDMLEINTNRLDKDFFLQLANWLVKEYL